MKTTLLAAAALLICASPVLAGVYEMECSAPTTLVGEDTDSNPVVRISVRYSGDDRSWQVFHTLRNGAVVSRSGQYGMTDMSGTSKTQWQGKLLRQPWLTMIGELKRNTTGGYDYGYHEWMYDSKRNNALVMQSWAPCKSAQQLPKPTAQQPTQPFVGSTAPIQPNSVVVTPERTQPQPPLGGSQPAARPAKDSVPIKLAANGHIQVDVLVGGQPLRMVVDTGATASTIPTGFASMLIRDGKAVELGNITVTYADGRKGQERLISISELRLGAHTLRNVKASISEGPALLGVDIINGIGPFTIDTRAGELIFHTAKS